MFEKIWCNFVTKAVYNDFKASYETDLYIWNVLKFKSEFISKKVSPKKFHSTVIKSVWEPDKTYSLIQQIDEKLTVFLWMLQIFKWTIKNKKPR